MSPHPVAAQIARSRLALNAIDVEPSQRPATEAGGYAMQAEVNSALTALGLGHIAGHKIGCTTPVMQAFLGIPNPCAGDVFAATVIRGGGAIARSNYRKLGIECEIVVELGRDIAPDKSPFTLDSMAEAVAAVMVGIEIVDDRYRDYRALGVPTLIADNFFNAGAVLGEPVRDWRRLDLVKLIGTTTINGREAGRGSGDAVLGHPLRALAWLANSRAQRGLGLEAGRFVFLGSLVETKWLAAGDQAAVSIDGLGTLRLNISS